MVERKFHAKTFKITNIYLKIHKMFIPVNMVFYRKKDLKHFISVYFL